MQPSPAQPLPTGREPAVVSLDARALARLHELDPSGELGVVRRVLVAFEASLVRMLAQLAAQRDAGAAVDTAQITLLAHTIKSSAASLGATQLSQACADTERRCRQGDFSAMQHDLQRLLSEGAAALAAVRAMLAS
jgi:HPt (histidine-containing phosphotransfer) domain-containing protein